MHIKLCAFEVFVFMDEAVCNSAVRSEPNCLKKGGVWVSAVLFSVPRVTHLVH